MAIARIAKPPQADTPPTTYAVVQQAQEEDDGDDFEDDDDEFEEDTPAPMQPTGERGCEREGMTDKEYMSGECAMEVMGRQALGCGSRASC